MTCEKCKKNQAVTHIRQNINGVQSEMYLCEYCAAEISEKFGQQYNKLFSDFGFGMDSMLGSIFGQDFLTDNLISRPQERCEMCGTSFDEIRRTGNVGCKKCYETFREQLMPLIQRIHGNTTHNGRIPVKSEAKKTPKEKIRELEAELKKSVSNQEFEKAAKVRDEIKKFREEQ